MAPVGGSLTLSLQTHRHVGIAGSPRDRSGGMTNGFEEALSGNSMRRTALRAAVDSGR